MAIVVLVVALIGIGVGFGIYNTPEKRVNRQLQTAYKYLQEGDYEKAALAFEQVIAVDKKCIEAYAKGLDAYVKGGNEEKAKDLYDRALKQILELDDDQLDRNMEYVVDVYLMVEDLFGNDPEHMVEDLEQAFDRTNGDERIKALLVESYLVIAADRIGSGRYEDCLEVCDCLLELDRTNGNVLSGVANCLNAYMEKLLEQERYEKFAVWQKSIVKFRE